MSDNSMLSEKANVILAQFPGPVTIRPSKWKMVALFSPVSLLTAAAAWILWSLHLPPRAWLVIGGFLGLPLLLMVTLAALQFVKHMPRLTFDLEGFLMTNLLGSSWTRWQDVNRFRSTVGVIAFVNASRPKGFLGLDNSHCFLPSLYQLKSREISRLMTAWRERALMPWSKASTARDD